MQLSDVPDLAHTRPHAMHWLATATAMAGVVALAGLLQPGAAASQSGAESRTVTARNQSPLPPPGTTGVDFPLGCGPSGTRVTKKASGDLDGDGNPETVAAVRCDSGAGTPPTGVFVVTRGTGARAPRVVATLVAPKDNESVGDRFAVEGGVVVATLLGYSTPDVPKCCPDEKQRVSWQWKSGSFVRNDLADGRSV